MSKVREAKVKTRATKRPEKKVAAKAEKAVKAARPSRPTWKGKTDGKRGVETLETAKVAQQQVDPTVGPAVTRAMMSLANQLELGGNAKGVALEAAKEFAGSPEAMAAFKKVIPFLEKNAVELGKKVGAPVLGKVGTGTLPLLADGELIKATLKVASDVGGPGGRRLVGAAMRGLNSGNGVMGAVSEMMATSAKMGVSSGAVGEGAKQFLAQAMPVLGNGLNLLALGSSVKQLASTFKEGGTWGQRLARGLHLAATITGCFVPPVGLAAAAIDLGSAMRSPSRA